jgi:hypothetical protein
MTTIPIPTLLPTSGAAPSNGYDPTSQAAYTEWDLYDEARFAVVVPDGYAQGADFFLSIRESSDAESANHRWQVTTNLLRPGVHAANEQTAVETIAQEYESASAQNQLSLRSLKITGSGAAGTVAATPIAAGDMLTTTMKRTAADSDEDPGPVKVFDLAVETAVSAAAVSDCQGRVGRIIDAVRDLFNEAAGGFLSDAFILRAINRCRLELAQADYWRRETWIPAYASENTVNLLEAVAAFQDLHQVSFRGQDHPMTPAPSFRDYLDLKTRSSSVGVPERWIVQNNVLYVWPAPSSGLQSGYCLYHSYTPPELTCASENPNPDIPKPHDSIFVYFALQQAFLRDRHAPGADVKFEEFTRLYEQSKQSLLGQGDPPALSLRSYRR